MSARRSPRGSVDRNCIAANKCGLCDCVAPRAGAWIETRGMRIMLCASESLPARERGSKRVTLARLTIAGIVAPRAGAWIETVRIVSSAKHGRSLPARERGSKPMRAACAIAERSVAPRAGAWIETISPAPRRGMLSCRSPRGSVDRNNDLACALFAIECRSPRGSVDRNVYMISSELEGAGRSPRGSVDRNTRKGDALKAAQTSLPARERGSKRLGRGRALGGAQGRSPRGSVD